MRWMECQVVDRISTMSGNGRCRGEEILRACTYEHTPTYGVDTYGALGLNPPPTHSFNFALNSYA